MKPEIIKISRDEVMPTVDMLKSNHPEIFKIHSHTNQWEKALIYNLVSGLPLNSYIQEIGAHLGATSLTMSLAAEKNKSNVLCVDNFNFKNMGEPEAKNAREALHNLSIWMENVDRQNCAINWEDSVEAAKKWKKEILSTAPECKFNLIFFDADHSYKGITGDINAWLPLCNLGCLLVFHDYGGLYGRLAIRNAVRELIWPVQDGPGYTLESIYYCRYRGRKQ